MEKINICKEIEAYLTGNTILVLGEEKINTIRNFEIDNSTILNFNKLYDNIVVTRNALDGVVNCIEQIPGFLDKVSYCLSENGKLILYGDTWGKNNSLLLTTDFSYPGRQNEHLLLDVDLLFKYIYDADYEIEKMINYKGEYLFVLYLKNAGNCYWERFRLHRLAENEWSIQEQPNRVVQNLQDVSFGITEQQNYRVDQVGPYRITYKVDAKIDYRIEYFEILKIANSIVNITTQSVFLGGSQSPLSCKLPTEKSDVDLYLTATNIEDVVRLCEKLRLLEKKINDRTVSIGIIHPNWLKMPFFAETVDIKASNYLWEWSYEKCMEEYKNRMIEAQKYIERITQKQVLQEIKSIYGTCRENLDFCRIIATPRWKSIQDGGKRLFRWKI